MSYCLKCNKERKTKKTRNERITLLLKYVVCGSKKATFIKEQEASGLSGSLGMKTTFIIKLKKCIKWMK